MASVCFVAGDPSGDAHAAHLIEALRRRRSALDFWGLGGPAMRESGAALLEDLTQAAAIGPFDAARHLGLLRRAKRRLGEALAKRRPDLAVLVDFGDYNLPVIAPLLKRHGIPIVYYISPQIWAWGRFRLNFVRRYIDRMIVFFPFEEKFYKEAGVAVTWVGHPLVERARPSGERDQIQRRLGLNPNRMTVGLLPGSRASEIRRHLPIMLGAADVIRDRMPGMQFLISCAPGRREGIARMAGVRGDLQIAEGHMYDALQAMDAAIVASGTATLEAALCGVPMSVVYRTSWPTYYAARLVLRVPDIALVNVVAGRRVVPEFVQHRAHPDLIGAEVIELLRKGSRRDKMKADLKEVAATLGPPGATARAAEAVLQLLPS